MSYIKSIFSKKVPIGVVITLLILIVIGFFSFIFISKEKLNYTLFVGDMSVTPEELEFGSIPALGDFDFFNKVKNSFLENKADFMEANLSEMIIRVYIKGENKYEAPILTKGREGSWWETPAGIYKIETMEKNHFSSFGHVYQPWSMSFQGNFFIHGWPYYPSGMPVESEYSGGCIRLSDESAKEIFKMAYMDMPIIVFEEDFNSDGFVYHSKPPELSASAYLVADIMNNYVLLDKNRSEIMPIASITKLMTALIAGEFINLDKEIYVPEEALIQTSKPRLSVGEKISAYDLLFPLLMESSNEAAEVFARNTSKNWYISLMNRKASSIGMLHTEFADPSGIDKENKSTCMDLFNLSKYIFNNRSFIFKISAGRMEKSAYGEPSFKNLSNFNLFSENQAFIGGKVGKTTAAKETFLGVFNLDFSEEKRPIAIIILGSNDVYSDTVKVLDWLKSNYQ
ncbi:MAG: L,D-transpeptidase family protein [Candidatus Colwellbacteria bacterium]|nr:L,D-transpeptidase family protein [Candidatus Colwellbacteria bacterium]